MSLPPELRVLCAQLSSTPTTSLPRMTPSLLQYVQRCHVPLSSPPGNASKADAPAASVLVHKLKTQLTTLLNGKSQEGRFAAVILIKGVVDVGGWEVLRSSESWVRGLLSMLGKPDSAATKELSILALTKIYCLTHQYPTLIREVTTPTLPTFVTSCLNVISNSSKVAPSWLVASIFQAFAVLMPHHTTIFRPFTSQLRLIIKPYIAPTMSDGLFVPLSLKKSARCLVTLLHQTVAKNAGGEEWSMAVRELVRNIHVTADNVFRAVVEDWESISGYVGEPVNVNRELSGGAKSAQDLPQWVGIAAGVERLTGLLEMLAEYFRSETSTTVSIPLAAIGDVVTRMLSIALSSSDSSARQGSSRLHPAIDRDERDGLWCGLPQIYVAALQLIDAVAERMQENFMPLAQGYFDQLVWVYAFGRNTPEFRMVAYTVTARILLHIGMSFDKNQAAKLAPTARSCCEDLLPLDANSSNAVGTRELGGKSLERHLNQNADTFLQGKQDTTEMLPEDTNLVAAAKKLLPLVLSHVPQQYLDISLRSLLERTAILTNHKEGMMAGVLSPFVGKNGRALATVLPHLSRAFGEDQVVEVLLRPRMPLLPSAAARLPTNEALDEEADKEYMDFDLQDQSTHEVQLVPDAPSIEGAAVEHPGLGPKVLSPVGRVEATLEPNLILSSQNISLTTTPGAFTGDHASLEGASAGHQAQDFAMEDGKMQSDEASSDEESVHLTMELDSDSE